MAVQSTIYDLEATDIRFFLSTKPIASKSHVAIWIKGDDDIYRITNESEYELINDNIVFPTHPSGKALELRVGDTPSDLVQAPNDIAIVSAIAGEVVIVADSMQDVVTVSENITQVTIVSDNMTELLVISTNIDQVLLSKEYAVNPENVAITDNPTDYSSLHYSKKAEQSAVDAQTVVDSVNFPAGLIMEWHTDRKPTGWLWCDGESYTVFSPNPALAYDELYQVLVDATYVMTTKPVDWDTNYPDAPNGWYDPSFVGSVVTQAELDLLVTIPDRRGLFVRGKDQAGSVIPARGIDTHGVVPFNAIIQSQNKAHVHVYDKWTILGGGLYDTGGANNGQSTATDSESEGGTEGHGTYTPTNYIIRAKGSYNGDGSGSGGTGVVPIASEIEYSDTHSEGVVQLQDSTDLIFERESIVKVKGSILDTSYTAGSFQSPDAVFGDTRISQQEYKFKLNGDLVHVGSGFSQNTRIANITPTATTYQSFGAVDIVWFYDPYGDYVFTWDSQVAPATLKAFKASDGSAVKTWNRTVALNNLVSAVTNMSGNNVLTVNTDDDTTDAIASMTINDFTTDAVIEAQYDMIFRNYEFIFRIQLKEGGWIVGGNDLYYIWRSGLGWKTLDVSATLIGSNDYRIAYDRVRDKYYVAINYITAEIYEASIDDTGVVTIVGDSLGQKALSLGATFEVNDGVLLLSDYPTVALTTYVPSLKPIIAEYSDAYIAKNNKGTVTSGELGVESWSFGNGGSKAIGNYSSVFGTGSIANNTDEAVFGKYNDHTTADTLLVVGIGASDIARLNGLEIYDTGDILIPNRLAVPNPKSALTKDIGDGLYHAKEATTFTGIFLIANGDTVTVNNGIITSVAP